MSNTNSNSITSILVYALNNKKSGFRGEMIKKFRNEIALFNQDKSSEEKIEDIPDDIIFYDGTHTALQINEMQGSQVDIYGKGENGAKPLILIEVKASIGEDLQPDSQSGQNCYYANTAKIHHISLFYIIPEGYSHDKNIPYPESNLSVTKYYWPEIRDTANIFDNTGLVYQIENFVDIIKNKGNSSLFSKKEKRLIFLEPEMIKETICKINDLNNILYEVLFPPRKHTPKTPYDIGYPFGDNNEYWLGIKPNAEKKYLLSLGISSNEAKDIKFEDVYYDGGYYYYSWSSDGARDAQPNIIEALKNKIDDPLKEWLGEEETANNINAVYSLRDKLLKLNQYYISKKFSKNLENLKKENGELKDDNAIGTWVKDDTFLGLNLNVLVPDEPNQTIEKDYIFSLAISNELIDEKKAEDNGAKAHDNYYYFSLSADKDLLYKFIFSETEEEQKNNYFNLVDATWNKILNRAN